MTLTELIQHSFKEDLPDGDITTMGLNLTEKWGRAQLVAKEDLILSGQEVFEKCIHYLDTKLHIKWYFKNGDLIYKDQCIAHMEGNLIPLIQAERVALNFTAHLTGIATLTKLFVNEVQHTHCKILDTRKTTPLLRDLEKKAVTHGGGVNHRINLSDGVLIKENHIRMAGGITQAVEQIRKSTALPIEVEVTDFNEIKEASPLDIQRLMLDNMSNELMAQALKIIPPHIETEASGNMTLERVKSVAELGINFISVGALTHSAPTADLSLLFQI